MNLPVIFFCFSGDKEKRREKLRVFFIFAKNKADAALRILQIAKNDKAMTKNKKYLRQTKGIIQ